MRGLVQTKLPRNYILEVMKFKILIKIKEITHFIYTHTHTNK